MGLKVFTSSALKNEPLNASLNPLNKFVRGANILAIAPTLVSLFKAANSSASCLKNATSATKGAATSAATTPRPFNPLSFSPAKKLLFSVTIPPAMLSRSD